MFDVNSPLTTSFQIANFLLRNKKWEQALRAYNKLWTSSEQLREMLSWNMNYLLRKAPADTLAVDVRKTAINYLQQGGGWSAVTSNRNEIQPEDASAKALDRHINQLVTDKILPKTPNERHILHLASEKVGQIGHDAAYFYAKRHMPEQLRYTLHILKANASLSRGDKSGWLSHLNQYLQKFGVEPLVLRGENNLLSGLATKALPHIEQGPLVTVIMPAWNAQDTVEFAARSILNQTWRPIELIIVDDASTDGTWPVLQRLAKADSRVRILRNRRNVGPYVSKNIALISALGDFVTGHDSDDWAHPQRIEHHIGSLLTSDGAIRASVGYMLRLTTEGRFSFITPINDFSFDGAARKALISCMFHREDLTSSLGFWDTVRFAADSEMMSRARLLFGSGFQNFSSIGMLCLDHAKGLTNDPVHGIRALSGGLSDSRKAYRDSWFSLHRSGLLPDQAYLPFPQQIRRYDAVQGMAVSYEDQISNLSSA